MAELSWEKPSANVKRNVLENANRLKFGVISLALIGVVGFLLISGTASSGRYFMSISMLAARPDLAGQTVKVTGAVIGSTIQNDSSTHTIRFTLANLNDDAAALQKVGGLGNALHLAAIDPTAKRLNVVVYNQPMPDLLQNEAQAIVTGKVMADGSFRADEVLLKCPSRYQSDLPKQAAQANTGR